MSKLFITYSRADKEFVESLFVALSQHDHEIWVDWESIPPSAEWLQEIYSGIEQADGC